MVSEMNFALKIAKRIVDFLEKPYPFIYVFLTFFFAQGLRSFLDGFSSGLTVASFEYYSFFSYAYISSAMALILFFYIATKENIEKICRVILPSFVLMCIAPITDLVVSLGKGYSPNYILPKEGSSLLVRFFTFFGLFNGTLELTPGQTVEIVSALIIGGLYIYLKTKRLLRTAIFVFLGYCLVFVNMATPPIFDILKLNYNNLHIFRSIYLLMAFIFGIAVFYLYSKGRALAILRQVRMFTLLHFELMFVLGIIIAYAYAPGVFELRQYSVFRGLLILIAIMFASVFSAMISKITDAEINGTTNPNKALGLSGISYDAYKKTAWIFFGLASLYAYNADHEYLLIMLIFLGNFYVYSAPPFRLKRVPVISKLVISVNSLLIVVAGFDFSGNTLDKFPPLAYVYFLIGLTGILNYVDIKNYEGDKKAGIKTLPVIMGLERSRLFIGFSFVAVYLTLFFVVMRIYFFAFILICGLAQFFLINRRVYNESLVAGLYLVSLGGIMLFMFLEKYPLITNVIRY